MRHILLADIFGFTGALQALADQLPGDWQIIDPYDGAEQNFQDEAQAYACFQKVSGVDIYARQLSNCLAQADNERVNVVGFSVGASALWQVLASDMAGRINIAVGFYGNQIRHALDSEPRCPVTLVLPESEIHFSVPELAASLIRYPQVKLQHSADLHGFMNPASVNYSAVGYAEYRDWLHSLLSNRAGPQA